VFGEEILLRPYGITGFKADQSIFELYVTDNFENLGVDPPETLDNRVRHFQFSVNDAEFDWKLVRSFGDLDGPGVLNKVETLVADPKNQRILIAEEAEKTIKIYDLEGRFTGNVIGKGVFQFEPEGIALRDLEGGGYWIMTDQDINSNTFLLLTRDEFEVIVQFQGPQTRNTDGVTLTNQGYSNFPAGAFFAVDNDLAVTGFDLREIDRLAGESN